METIRRDSCLVVQKMMAKSVRMLFQDPDLSAIKAYVQRQFVKIQRGQCSMEDFIFSKKVRHLSDYSDANKIPAAVVAQRAMRSDRRRTPLLGERVRYVVVKGEGTALFRLVMSPEDMMRKGKQLNYRYYINQQIINGAAWAQDGAPPLELTVRSTGAGL